MWFLACVILLAVAVFAGGPLLKTLAVIAAAICALVGVVARRDKQMRKPEPPKRRGSLWYSAQESQVAFLACALSFLWWFLLVAAGCLKGGLAIFSLPLFALPLAIWAAIALHNRRSNTPPWEKEWRNRSRREP